MKTLEERRNRAIRLLAEHPATESQSQPLQILDDLQSLGLVERTKIDIFHNGRNWPSYSTSLTAEGRKRAAALSSSTRGK